MRLRPVDQNGDILPVLHASDLLPGSPGAQQENSVRAGRQDRGKMLIEPKTIPLGLRDSSSLF